jgi:hypothetical protein
MPVMREDTPLSKRMLMVAVALLVGAALGSLRKILSP